MNVMNCPEDSKLYALFKFVGKGNLYLATANNYTEDFTVQSSPILHVGSSSSGKHDNLQLYRSAGVFSDDGNILKLWITAEDTKGVWTVFYTQAIQEDGIWTVRDFTTPRAPIMTVQNTQYLNTTKQWMLSQGDYTDNYGVKRKFDEIWGYKTGHTPKITTIDMGEYTQIEVTPTDSQDVPDYQVMIPASKLNISSQSDSLDIERVQAGVRYPSEGVINWKGQDWYLTRGISNPGNNYWNNTGAWIDNQDRLHLTIVNDDGKWKCTMLNSQNNYQYGTLTWTVASPIYTFDKNSVVGLCTYLDDYHELDIEPTRWGETIGEQLWYTVQPAKIKGNFKGYPVPSSIDGTNTTYRIEWKPTYVRFTSMQADGKIIGDYLYENVSGIPQEPESIIMNLWLNKAMPPSDGKNIELIISDFTYTKD